MSLTLKDFLALPDDVDFKTVKALAADYVRLEKAYETASSGYGAWRYGYGPILPDDNVGLAEKQHQEAKLCTLLAQMEHAKNALLNLKAPTDNNEG